MHNQPPSKSVSVGSNFHRYFDTVLAACEANIRSAAGGNFTNRVNRAAFNCKKAARRSSLAGLDAPDDEWIADRLLATALSAGYDKDPRRIRRNIARGLAAAATIHVEPLAVLNARSMSPVEMARRRFDAEQRAADDRAMALAAAEQQAREAAEKALEDAKRVARVLQLCRDMMDGDARFSALTYLHARLGCLDGLDPDHLHALFFSPRFWAYGRTGPGIVVRYRNSVTGALIPALFGIPLTDDLRRKWKPETGQKGYFIASRAGHNAVAVFGPPPDAGPLPWAGRIIIECEGPEKAVALLLACPGVTVCTPISADLGSYHYPGARRVIVFGDRKRSRDIDIAKRGGEGAARNNPGIPVSVALPCKHGRDADEQFLKFGRASLRASVLASKRIYSAETPHNV